MDLFACLAKSALLLGVLALGALPTVLGWKSRKRRSRAHFLSLLVGYFILGLVVAGASAASPPGHSAALACVYLIIGVLIGWMISWNLGRRLFDAGFSLKSTWIMGIFAVTCIPALIGLIAPSKSVNTVEPPI